VVILVTYGGSANVAFRVARLLQTLYDEVVVCAPSVCKSAGTLIAAGAHRIVRMVFGEFGPLDIQLSRRDEIWGRRSGLTTRSALLDLKDHGFELFEHFMYAITAQSRGAVSFKLAAEIAGKISAEMMSKIYAQVNPEALGQDFMDLAVAAEYCKRLERNSQNLKPGAIHRLVYEYPSHDFVIDAQEAQEIFINIDPPGATILRYIKDRAADAMKPRIGATGIVEMLAMSAEQSESKSFQGSTKEAEKENGAQAASRGDGRGTAAPT